MFAVQFTLGYVDEELKQLPRMALEDMVIYERLQFNKINGRLLGISTSLDAFVFYLYNSCVTMGIYL